MIPVTPGPPEIERVDLTCLQCEWWGHIHNYAESPGQRRARAAWVTEQHAEERYTHKTIIAQEWQGGDCVIDRDGDIWFYEERYGWHALPLDAENRFCQRRDLDDICREQGGEGFADLPNYEPYAVWYLMPRVPAPPKFNSPSEAQAWLDLHSSGV